MIVSDPVLAVTALVMLTMIARRLDYRLTSASLITITGSVVSGLVVIHWMFD